MKSVLLLGAFLLIFSVPAYGQHAGAAGTPAATPNSGGGGGGGGMGVAGGGGLLNVPVTQFHFLIASGSESDFKLTSYLAFDKAVAEGRVVLSAKSVDLGKVAREYRSKKALAEGSSKD